VFVGWLVGDSAIQPLQEMVIKYWISSSFLDFSASEPFNVPILVLFSSPFITGLVFEGICILLYPNIQMWELGEYHGIAKKFHGY